MDLSSVARANIDCRLTGDGRQPRLSQCRLGLDETPFGRPGLRVGLCGCTGSDAAGSGTERPRFGKRNRSSHTCCIGGRRMEIAVGNACGRDGKCDPRHLAAASDKASRLILPELADQTLAVLSRTADWETVVRYG